MNFGLKIKIRRIEMGYTQKELAYKVGISPITMCRYERLEREPNIKVMKEISKQLNIPVQELFFEEEGFEYERA